MGITGGLTDTVEVVAEGVCAHTPAAKHSNTTTNTARPNVCNIMKISLVNGWPSVRQCAAD